MRLLPTLRVMGVAGLVVAAAVGAMVMQPSRASANCYELIGCTDSNYFKPAELSNSLGSTQHDLQRERLLLQDQEGQEALRE